MARRRPSAAGAAGLPLDNSPSQPAALGHGRRRCHARRFVPRAGSFTGTLFAALSARVSPFTRARGQRRGRPHHACLRQGGWAGHGSAAKSARGAAGPPLRHSLYSALGLCCRKFTATPCGWPWVASPRIFLSARQRCARSMPAPPACRRNPFGFRLRVAGHSWPAFSSAPHGRALLRRRAAQRGIFPGKHPRPPRCALLRATLHAPHGKIRRTPHHQNLPASPLPPFSR